MATIVLCSLGGSPGVTTTALALGLSWPRPVLVADCDPHPNQAVLAGYLQGVPAGNRGLMGMAQAYREHRHHDASLDRQTIPVAEGVSFLPGFTHPKAASLFDRFWPALADQFALYGQRGTDVIVDAGRVQPPGLATPLVAAANLVIVMTHSTLRSLASLRLGLEQITTPTDETGTDWSLLLRANPHGYSEREVGTLFEAPVCAVLPDAPADAAVVSDGAVARRRFDTGAWWKQVATLARTLSAGISPEVMV